MQPGAVLPAASRQQGQVAIGRRQHAGAPLPADHGAPRARCRSDPGLRHLNRPSVRRHRRRAGCGSAASNDSGAQLGTGTTLALYIRKTGVGNFVSPMSVAPTSSNLRSGGKRSSELDPCHQGQYMLLLGVNDLILPGQNIGHKDKKAPLRSTGRMKPGLCRRAGSAWCCGE
jgi:hypothetical protein